MDYLKQQYRKTFLPAQIVIVFSCTIMYWKGVVTLPGVAAAFLAMQLGSFAGIWWGARLRRRFQPDLPSLGLTERRRRSRSPGLRR